MTHPTSSEPSRRTFIAAAGALSTGLIAAAADQPPLAPPDKQPPNLKLPEVVEKTVGFAVVGLGQLSLEEVLPAFAQCKLARPVALVSGHPDKAKRIAAAYGIGPKNLYDYETYDRLKDNPAVDAIYVVLPNHMHAEYTIRGFAAGKHVLCEKPMAPTSDECRKMIAAGRAAKKKLMVAYRLHYEPFNRTAMKLCADKALGALRTIAATNCQVTKAPNIRLSRATAGGPLGDIGIYCLNACRYLTREEPTEVTAFAHQPANEPRFREVPQGVSFTLRFPSGVLANCDCNFDAAESRYFRVNGSEGFLEMDRAFAYRGQRLVVGRPGRQEELALDPVNHFAAEMDHFASCVLHGTDPQTPGEEGQADMVAIEAIQEAAANGRAVKVKR
ncbi:glucose-fructose oxidoreductase : Glucose-fructose oxidoreductase OS=Chondromyces apiculatus DSM 436 GN=CAP_4221 PE=4 SV=1: GFO_IDH_MocA: GFO_IDH_MocA_C [Gemmataceae bacterium]|nr:glucose-fructose oxidoreductase : Glucose-fructose oxidoreductase OS=Chondromyces apiculatus DSM 436 GN=CAP_4221 PE=4 SV=1: GFO_IDH_MocA: GFO_IDH_MocA_C [Gemmataceae bacterium]VTT97747.1 glucose-fructose oxidoreductase : Glucose-fructose oxidoreductase OS=Chondromyces apiculatus DSM 436 GN=CAP_4221 PE=4 SV=1: GFO_IDH_MocA: GFO_IDH_MocA_C [Gemmataceae bacterium]